MDHPRLGRCDICSTVQFVVALIEPPDEGVSAGFQKDVALATSVLKWIEAAHSEFIELTYRAHGRSDRPCGRRTGSSER